MLSPVEQGLAYAVRRGAKVGAVRKVRPADTPRAADDTPGIARPAAGSSSLEVSRHPMIPRRRRCSELFIESINPPAPVRLLATDIGWDAGVGRITRRGAGLLDLLTYHAVLAVKDDCADAFAAWRRSTILDSCARRDLRDAGNPAQEKSRGIRS